MRLKELLKEDNGDAKEKLISLLKNKYRTTDPLLLRGTDDKVDLFKEKQIRKDRKPRDTDEKTDVIVSAVEDEFYSNYPKRQESKFAVTEDRYDTASEYGSNVYYCFPHNSAFVASLPNDAIDYLPNYVAFELRELLDSVDYMKAPAILGFVETYLNTKTSTGATMNQLYSYIRREWGEMLEEYNKLHGIRNTINDKDAANKLQDVGWFIGGIKKYFDELEQGVRESSGEVLFDGPSYLVVSRSYKDLLKKIKNGKV